ncbi:MAG TPA: hypothetical protein LFW20_00115 [Rickettsia endosymbiont of Omalisus fontisbellaquei]|nr:hypothetical protein [Rickettsia endosymbiont of Omalisus fontisbellaquei]
MLIKQIYSMVVCFVTTIVMLVTLALTFKEFITLSLPEYTNEQLVKYSTNEQYLSLKSFKYEELKNLSPRELEELRIKDRNEYIEIIKARAISTVTNCLIWMIISLGFFIVHWKIYKNTQKQ